MTGPIDNSLSGKDFRAGTAYDLVPFERLPAEERLALAELRADSDFFGVLMPRPGTGRTIKALGKDTALLWYALQSPGTLPAFAVAGDADVAHGRIASWLLDGIIEVQNGGQFVSGAEAASLLHIHKAAPEGQWGKVELLTHAALRYGESLRLDNPQELAGRLYGFGRQPLTPSWAKALANREAVLTFVAGEASSEIREELRATWQEANAERNRGWLVWSHIARAKESAVGMATYKLYVSPDIRFLRQAFGAVLQAANLGVRSFKIGADASGLLRPDKMVLYFNDQETLFNTATRLAELLKGVKAHGVPFSAAITSDGLLSWGMDPPDSERLVSWQEQESWRLWIVRRLAAAMISAQGQPNATVSPAEYALTYLGHQGIDVRSWAPSISIWRKTS